MGWRGVSGCQATETPRLACRAINHRRSLEIRLLLFRLQPPRDWHDPRDHGNQADHRMFVSQLTQPGAEGEGGEVEEPYEAPSFHLAESLTGLATLPQLKPR